MKTTIDKAGRVVIPAAIRDGAGLTPGTELDITVDEFGIRLERVTPGPRLVKVGRRTVARPTVSADVRPGLDIATLIEDERNRWPERWRQASSIRACCWRACWISVRRAHLLSPSC